MSLANIKIPTEEIEELKRHTEEKTGQKAVERALAFFLREARQHRIVDVLRQIKFRKGFDPLKLRHNER